MDSQIVESLTPQEMLEILNLNAPVSRGVILQRTSEIAAGKTNDPAGMALVNDVGDRLASIAANMGGMTLVLDETGGTSVPLMDETSAVQDDPTLQAQPTFPQDIIEGSLNPIRRRALKTTVGINTSDFFPKLVTAQSDQVGWGVVGVPPWQDGCDEVQLTRKIIETSGKGPTDSLCTLNKLRQAREGSRFDTCVTTQEYRPTLADFSFRLPEKFERVLSITLSYLKFPGSIYNVGETNVCCTTSQENVRPQLLLTEVVTPGTLQTEIPVCNSQASLQLGSEETALVVDECFSQRTMYISALDQGGLQAPEWLSLVVESGTYTLEALISAIMLSGNNLLNEKYGIVDAFSITVNRATGFIQFANDNDEYAIAIAFPPKLDCVNAATTEALRSQDVTITDDCGACEPQELIKKPNELPGFHKTVVGTIGLGPLLGFSNYTFSIVTNPFVTEIRPASIFLPPAIGVSKPFPAQTLPLLESPRTFYFVLEDSVNSSFPTFIGSTGAATMSRMILAEFQVPVGSPTETFTFGNNQPLGFVYNKREYFGPVDIEKLTVKVVDKQGTPVDTRGRPFRFCLELERLYNL